MPTASKSKSKKVPSKDKSKSKEKAAESPAPKIAWRPLAQAVTAGAIFGLSAPGFDQWYLAWVGLAPLLLLSVASPNIWHASLRGLLFGTAYNLVYLNWYLHLHPLSWMGMADWQSIPLATFCWFFVSAWQGVITAIFSFAIRLIPLCGGVIPRKVEDKWKVPALVFIPLFWTALFEKLGNAHDLVGVPWSMIEYSQYKQTALIQIASIIGGVGLSVLIVAVNVAIASLIATQLRKIDFKSIAESSKLSAVCSLLALSLIVAGTVIFGFVQMQNTKLNPNVPLTVLQGNINIEMQKTTKAYTLKDLLQLYASQLKHCPSGLCVFTESALPTYLRQSPNVVSFLASAARSRQLDLVVGSIDEDDANRPYNSAFGIDRRGNLLTEAYHKRFLVPVGEYTPAFVKFFPDFIQKLTDTPAGTGFAAGKKPTVLNLSGMGVGPLICFETIAPELATSSVRNGAEVLVNISDLAWFHNSMIGDQTTACATFRAVETGRYFVYAANTGPSMVINPLGQVTGRTRMGIDTMLIRRVQMRNEKTLFSQWYH